MPLFPTATKRSPLQATPWRSGDLSAVAVLPAFSLGAVDDGTATTYSNETPVAVGHAPEPVVRIAAESVLPLDAVSAMDDDAAVAYGDEAAVTVGDAQEPFAGHGAGGLLPRAPIGIVKDDAAPAAGDEAPVAKGHRIEHSIAVFTKSGDVG